MKKIIAITVSIALLLTSTVAFANSDRKEKEKNKSCTKISTNMSLNSNKFEDVKNFFEKLKAERKSVKPVHVTEIKFGQLRLLVAPIEKSLGATVTYEAIHHIITVTKNTTIILFDLDNRKVTVNGVEDTSVKLEKPNKLKMIVLLKYIAEKLGYKIDVYESNLIIITPSTNTIPTPTPNATPAPSATPTPSPTPTATPTATPEPSPTPTPTPGS